MRLCNCSVCISYIAKRFVTDKNPRGRNVTKGLIVGHWCHVNQMLLLDLSIEYCHAVICTGSVHKYVVRIAVRMVYAPWHCV